MSDYISSGAYSADVHRNLRSGHIYADRVYRVHLSNALFEAAAAAEKLDFHKKALFYGKSIEEPYVVGGKLDGWLGLSNTPVDLFHGALGLITEAGEIAEAFADSASRASPLDEVNLREEIGDCLWYLTVMAKALGTTLEECARINTVKLRKRFPDTFTEDAALNRDLASERLILEADPRDEVFASGSDLDA